MYKFIFVSLCLVIFYKSEGQDILNSSKSGVRINSTDTLIYKAFKTGKNIPKIKIDKNKWDSIRSAAKNTPQTSSVTTETDASGASIPPVVMPSPNSASLINSISDNIDLYTGKASLYLPIYNLKCGSISVPIGLQANANAHKVNDIGSWVGLGMNLNAGGTITRVMKNLPDEYTGTICSAYNIPGWGYLTLKGGSQNIDLSNFDNYSVDDKKYIIDRGNWNKKNDQPDRGWDLQPDEFYFNFGNYSGKFVFDQDGGINLMPQANLKITPIFQIVNGVNKITGFIVLAEDGTKYEFGNSAGGNYSQAPVEESKLTTTTKSIQYTYRAIAVDNPINPQYFVLRDGYPVFAPSGYYAYEREPYMLGGIPGSSSGNPELACCIFDFDNSYNIDVTEYFSYPSSWMLRKITSATGDFVEFNYNTTANNISYLADRSFSASVPDLAEEVVGSDEIFSSPLAPVFDGARKIFVLPSKQFFSISISSIALQSRKLVSISTSDNTFVSFNSATAREDILNDTRLDNIVVNNGGAQIKKINFNYNIVNTTATDLPDEQFKFFYNHSRYWYDNSVPVNFLGMHSNFVLLSPHFGYNEQTRGTSDIWLVPSEYRKRMFLTSVQEEGNGALLPPYTYEYDNTDKLPFRTSLNQDYFGFATTANTSRHPFVGHPTTGILYYTYPNPSGSGTSAAPNTFSGIFGSPFPILYFKTLQSNGSWSNALYGGSKNYSAAAMKAGVLSKVTYPTGGYKEFQFEFNGNSSAWNGLRVYQTNEYESAGSTAISKNYTYGTFVNTDGIILNYSMAESGFYASNNFYFTTKRELFSSNRINPEATTRGSAGGYSYAEVSQTGNGKYRVEFNTANDFGDLTNNTYIASCHLTPPVVQTSFNFPYPAVTSFDWKRGLPKKEMTFNNSGLLIKSDEYFYPANPSLYGLKDIPSYNVSRYSVKNLNSVPSMGGNCPTIPPMGGWDWRLFGKTTYKSSWHPLIKKISRVYEQNGTNYTESIDEFDFRKYTYNNADYLLPYQQKNLKNSRNEQTISYSKFPLDYNLANTNDPYIQGMAYLLSRNILNAKVEQFSYKQDQNGNNKKYIGGILNQYHPNNPVPKETFKLKTNGLLNTFTESNTNTGWFYFDTHYNSEVNFPLYDANGRILEQNKTNDIKEAYIWDYNKAYPVAKAVNASNNDIAFSSFEADEAGANLPINPANVITDPSGAFTGRKYYSLTYPPLPYQSQPVTITINNPGKEYRLNFWYKEPVNNQPPVLIHTWPSGLYDVITPFAGTIKNRNGWRYSEYIIPASFDGYLTIIKGYSSSTTYIDEVRFYPAQSQMTSYTFEPLIGMTSETDINGKTTYYEYDALNRLSIVRNEDRDIVKTICYNYANQAVPCSVGTTACNIPVPVINSVVKTGSTGSNFIYNVSFTPSPNSTNCVIRLTDLTNNTITLIPSGCSSPATFQVPILHQFSIVLISYTAACPAGVSSLPYP